MLAKLSLQETVNKKNNIASNYRASLRHFFLIRFYCTLPSSNDANQKWPFLRILFKHKQSQCTLHVIVVCHCCCHQLSKLKDLHTTTTTVPIKVYWPLCILHQCQLGRNKCRQKTCRHNSLNKQNKQNLHFLKLYVHVCKCVSVSVYSLLSTKCIYIYQFI